jgi:hypothetical protein
MANITLIDNNNNKSYYCPQNKVAEIIGVTKNTITRWKYKALKENRVKEVYNQFEIIFIDEEIKQPARNVNTKRYV